MIARVAFHHDGDTLIYLDAVRTTPEEIADCIERGLVAGFSVTVEVAR